MMGRNSRWARFAFLAVLASLALALATAPALAQKRPITVEDMWAVKRPGAPSLSPDGRWAAVEVVSYSMNDNNSTSDIWLLSTDGAAQRQLTTHTARDSAPQFSPDGKWIAFTSRREGDDAGQIYVIPVGGGEARRVTKLSTGAGNFKWFADGKRIAFASSVWPDLDTDEAQARRARERRDAKVKAYLIEKTQYRNWDVWVADGRESHLFVVNMETGETRDLFAGLNLRLSGGYDISPDGNEVAFATDLSNDPGFMPNPDIVILNLQTKQWRNLTEDNKADDGAPAYSPDGKWLAYNRSLIPYAPDRSRIVLVDRASGAKRTLAEEWDRSAGAVTWSPDSQRLYFVAEYKARAHLWSIPPSGGTPRVVVEGGAISGATISGDGRTLAFVRTTMDRPGQVFAASADGTGARKIESFNDALIAQWDLGEVRDVTFKGWGDEDVQMWVIYPPGFDRSKKWPLLHAVHGGPTGAWLDQFHFRWNMHMFASRGYVVAAVNFHGSTGWGDAFADSIKGMYGTKELVDTEKGTDFLLAEGYIDAERLTAAGGSFGGFMVAFMNGNSQRYKAYVCHAGVFDYPAQMSSDFIRGRQRALGGFPWENPDIDKQAASSYAANMNTPTLIIHGELDYRVPLTQGLAYYNTLRMRQVPARLVYFPDENHWILKPQNSRLWHKEFFDWLERFAPAGGK
ncbi:MAG TPA: S9 family peptidase [Candidatus Acidoferrales bacterium]